MLTFNKQDEKLREKLLCEYFLCIPISRTFNKKDEKLSVKILCEYFVFILIGRACDASLLWFSHNLFKVPWRQNSQDRLLSKVNPAPDCSVTGTAGDCVTLQAVSSLSPGLSNS